MHTSHMTPAALGFRMPAEWEPHQCTWISWPHNQESWPGKFETVEPIMVQAVTALCRSETVHINVLNPEHEAHVRHLLRQVNGPYAIVYHPFPTNDAWCRDHGAIFVTRHTAGKTELAAIDCQYNAWGGKYPYALDNEIAAQMADYLNTPRYVLKMVLEGGSIDVNGGGLLLTTEQCLLNPNRNPQLTCSEIERNLRNTFGVEKILWLGDGIAGDDTDGHIDDITRFVSKDTVVTVVEDNPADDNYGPLQENLERLQAMTDLEGKPLRIITLPMPAPHFINSQRVPASYANFYIANKIVLLPCYNDPHDKIAQHTLQQCFPEREIVGIDCTDLIWGLGAFHCLTQQIPMAG